MSAAIRCGRWQDVLADVRECDALITDPPFSARTDAGFRSGSDVARKKKRMPKRRSEMPYEPLTHRLARELVASWVPRVREFFVVFGDHQSARWFEAAFKHHKLATFAPVPWVKSDGPPRFYGDGPANSCEWITIARRRKFPRRRFSRPGQYSGPIAAMKMAGEGNRAGPKFLTGAKPEWLMQALVRDYSEPGDLIVDPFAGTGSTLLAARLQGRRSLGAECDLATYAYAVGRLERAYTPTLPGLASERAEQLELA